ncbi:MAG: UDP-4-amino-4,6-dideoxy-N-acetyl-beta-L-altrosamine transaminase [Rhizomicrobium sp.]
MIPYGRQDITQADIDAVVSVLRSDFLTQGPMPPRFERAVASYCGAKHAVAANSATSALHIACLALDLGPGDWLWTSPITFVASANCGLYCGARVDFVDIDPRTYNLCPEALERKLIDAEKAGRLPKVVVAVHLCGQPCDMLAIHALGQKYGFRVIEDAAHAIGGRYRGQAIGNCRYSDITVFSFHPVKIITTAEGGMALTNDAKLGERMSLLNSHGVTRNPTLMTHEPDGPWYYQQVDLGFNYRMTDLQAALGISQLQRIDEMIAQRCFLADRYNSRLEGSGIILPKQMPYGQSAWHLYVIGWDEKRFAITRREAFEHLREAGIGVNVHYIPVHLQPYYRKMGFSRGQFPGAESYYDSAITVPLYTKLTGRQQDRVVDVILELTRTAKANLS